MDLCDALGVRRGDVVALVGGGGKTSALYRLGREAAARGMPVVLSGTARFTPPEREQSPNLTWIDPDAPPDALPDGGPWPRTVATGHGSKGRLLPVAPGWVDALHALHPDWVIVLEADGSAMRPFKAPAAHEPVIPDCATLVVPVVGLDVLGHPLDSIHVHRAEIVAALTGAAPGTPVTAAMVAAALAHPEGGRKATPTGARWIPLLNKADTPERLAAAHDIARLIGGAARRVVVGRLRAEPPEVTVVEA